MVILLSCQLLLGTKVQRCANALTRHTRCRNEGLVNTFLKKSLNRTVMGVILLIELEL